jgi:predicted nucleic acid-binding protein
LIVVDASATLCFLLNSPASRASALRQRLRGEHLQAPHLIDLEVAQTLRRFVLAGSLTPDRASDALIDLSQLPLIRHPHHPFLGRIWQLRSNVTAYDAAYVALAEVLGAPLLTLDARLAHAGTGASIEVF